MALAGTLQAKSTDHLLGPTGMMGADGKKQIKVTKIEKGSPADGKIKPGDIIVGANGQPFGDDSRREFANAINMAESTQAGGLLELSLKDGKKVTLALKVLGSFSDTAPYDCPKTTALVTEIADALLKTKAYEKEQMGVGWLGLMATGEDKYLSVVKSELPKQEWANPDRERLMSIVNGEQDSGYVGWYWGYSLLTLAEYHLLTGDKSVLPAIETYALALSRGQDPAGIWGHRMTSPERNGRLPGYSHINQPSLACFMGLILAQKCGIDDPVLNKAVDQCHNFYRTFTDKGTIPYGVHNPNSRDYNNNGMSGMTAIAMSMRKDVEGAKFFSRQVSVDSDRLETGHASHFFNVLWSPLGANVAGPGVTQEYNKRSRWLYTLYRSWDDRFTYDGATHKALETSGALLLNYCTPRKQLYITGKNADPSYWVTGSQVQEVMDYNKIDFKTLSVDELIGFFGHEAPQVRRGAVWELQSREGDVAMRLDELIRTGSDTEKISALGFFGYNCPAELVQTRVSLIGEVLKNPSENPEVRAAAASALSWNKPKSHIFYDDILKFLLEEKPGDTHSMVDDGLAEALIIMSANPYADGLVDNKELFYKAVSKLSHHPRQGTRGNAMKLIYNMPIEDFHLVADEVKLVIINQDPTSHSYHNPGATVLPAGQLMAKLGIKDGLEWAMQTMDTKDGKGSFKLKAVAGVINAYGLHARSVVEQIKENPERLKSFSSGKASKEWTKLMQLLDSGNKPDKELIGFDQAVKAEAK